jgi:hypothetical protein
MTFFFIGILKTPQFFTGFGGECYPPDIINIKRKNLKIIKETMLGNVKNNDKKRK